MNYKKYMKKSALVGAIALSLAMTGCGEKEAAPSSQADNATEQNEAVNQKMQEKVAETATPESTEDNSSGEKSSQEEPSEENFSFYLKAKFDDGELVLDQDGLSVKDSYGQAIFRDGKIDIKDKDGNVIMNNDGLWIKDEESGKNAVKIDKDGLYVEGDDAVVSWDKNGFKVNTEGANLSFNFAFPGSKEENDTAKKKTYDIFDEDWDEKVDSIGSLLSTTMRGVIDHSVDFINNKDWKTWDKVTILNCEETIDGKIVKTKIWFDDGKLKTMNIPEENMKVKGFELVETKDEDGNVIRIYQ